MSGRLDILNHSFWIVGPIVFLVKRQVRKATCNDTGMCKVHGIKVKLLICPFSGNSICSKRDGSREDVTTVIVCMFANQVNPTWGEKNLWCYRGVENFPEFFRYILFWH